MDSSAMLSSLGGGALIGLGANLLLLTLGRTAGITGILAGVLLPQKGDIDWRIGFLLGLFGAGTIAALFSHASKVAQVAAAATPLSLGSVAIAGLLVGFGARLGGGCTSGHGVCGVSRLSVRSIVATCVFIVTGALAVLVLRYGLGRLP